jgi:hypothetical protein
MRLRLRLLLLLLLLLVLLVQFVCCTIGCWVRAAQLCLPV